MCWAKVKCQREYSVMSTLGPRHSLSTPLALGPSNCPERVVSERVKTARRLA